MTREEVMAKKAKYDAEYAVYEEKCREVARHYNNISKAVSGDVKKVIDDMLGDDKDVFRYSAWARYGWDRTLSRDPFDIDIEFPNFRFWIASKDGKIKIEMGRSGLTRDLTEDIIKEIELMNKVARWMYTFDWRPFVYREFEDIESVKAPEKFNYYDEMKDVIMNELTGQNKIIVITYETSREINNYLVKVLKVTDKKYKCEATQYWEGEGMKDRFNFYHYETSFDKDKVMIDVDNPKIVEL